MQRILRFFLTFALLLAPLACKKPAAVAPPASSNIPGSPVADPLVAMVDLSEVRASHVRQRLATLLTEQPEDAAVIALVAAATDQLVVREMGVLGLAPQPTETMAQAADRFLERVWDARRGCDVADADLKWAYMQELGKFKHPPSWTVWDAQLVCCPSARDCPMLQSEACRKELRPLANRLAERVRRELAALPALGPAAEATRVTLEQSPLKDKHLAVFEQIVAEESAKEPRLQLRRYTYFQRGLPGFEKAGFRETDPAIEQAMAKLPLGAVAGPLDTDWGLDVVLLVAREPLRRGLDDPTVKDEVRASACQALARQQQLDYRQRLLKGARLEWRRETIRQVFGEAVERKLPPDATQREVPVLP